MLLRVLGRYLFFTRSLALTDDEILPRVTPFRPETADELTGRLDANDEGVLAAPWDRFCCEGGEVVRRPEERFDLDGQRMSDRRTFFAERKDEEIVKDCRQHR